MHELTEKQQQILSFIQNHLAQKGGIPTYREIQEAFAIKSPNGARKHVLALMRKGYLKALHNSVGHIRALSVDSKRGIPLLGRIAAGVPIEAIETHHEMLDVEYFGFDNKNGDLFALTVTGESMIEAHIMNGDTVIVKQQPLVGTHDIAAVLVNNEATLKYVRPQADGSILLVPANAALQPLCIQPERGEHMRILGKVISVVRRL